MSVQLVNLTTQSKVMLKKEGPFMVIGHQIDRSATPFNAEQECYMKTVGIDRKQIIAELKNQQIIVQPGSIQWLTGNISEVTEIKNSGGFFKKIKKGIVEGESPLKPAYSGTGVIAFEPTYRYFVFEDASNWGPDGFIVPDEYFLACESSVNILMKKQRNDEDDEIYNLNLTGNGKIVLMSPMPREELLEVKLVDDVLKIDGDFVICHSASLTVSEEESPKKKNGSYHDETGPMTVFEGTGSVLMVPVLSSEILFERDTKEKSE